MSNYLRNYQTNGIYFFTLNLNDRRKSYLTDNFSILQCSMNKVRKNKPFKMLAWVVLPNHLHLLWSMPGCDNNYSERIRALKVLFCKGLERGSIESPVLHRIWQPRFWEHTIKSNEDLNAHINYIHINPVKHGYVSNVYDWPYSSFHYFFDKGKYSKEWAGTWNKSKDMSFGE